MPGVPKGYYKPLWVYAGDMLPDKNARTDDEPDCRRLIRECLSRKRNSDKCIEWIAKNNLILEDDSPEDRRETLSERPKKKQRKI